MAGALVTVVLLSACGSSDPGGAGEGPKTAATVAPIADLVQRVAGDRIEVQTMVPEGQDSHTYLPNPSDARALAGIEIFVDNGYGLNAAILDFAAQNLPDDIDSLFLGEETVTEEEVIAEGDCHGGDPGTAGYHCHEGSFNAHMWPNIAYALRYVDAIEEKLIAVDPEGKDAYGANADELRGELEELDAAAKEIVESIPADQRKLVVYHDSWSYFAREYGMEVIGAIQPADFSEPSAAELREMIGQIQAEGVRAFFGSEVFPSDVLQTVAQESGAEYVADLSDDDLPGEPGDEEHSYIGMMVNNLRVIADALGGDSSPLKDIDPAAGG